MIRPKVKRLRARETRSLLDITPHTLNDELSRESAAQAYDLPGEKVLFVYERGRGMLYESKAELQAMLEEVEQQARRGAVHICSDLPQGQAFIDQLPELIRALAALLHLDSPELDGSEASLIKVDKELRRLPRDQFLNPEVFAPLTAYVGEVMRNVIKGKWEMRRARDADVWEPWIVDPCGNAYAPFGIYKDLLEYGKTTSTRAFVSGTLGAWKLGTAIPRQDPPRTPVAVQVIVLPEKPGKS